MKCNLEFIERFGLGAEFIYIGGNWSFGNFYSIYERVSEVIRVDEFLFFIKGVEKGLGSIRKFFNKYLVNMSKWDLVWEIDNNLGECSVRKIIKGKSFIKKGEVS